MPYMFFSYFPLMLPNHGEVSLRNGEHLARFIHCGAWVSYQMLEGFLASIFAEEMEAMHLVKLNQLPRELREEDPKVSQMGGRGRIHEV